MGAAVLGHGAQTVLASELPEKGSSNPCDPGCEHLNFRKREVQTLVIGRHRPNYRTRVIHLAKEGPLPLSAVH